MTRGHSSEMIGKHIARASALSEFGMDSSLYRINCDRRSGMSRVVASPSTLGFPFGIDSGLI
jgi:hypothetical protein